MAEQAGLDRAQAEAIAEELRSVAGADRGELVTRGELYRASWPSSSPAVHPNLKSRRISTIEVSEHEHLKDAMDGLDVAQGAAARAHVEDYKPTAKTVEVTY